jgi:hypothetical protein
MATFSAVTEIYFHLESRDFFARSSQELPSQTISRHSKMKACANTVLNVTIGSIAMTSVAINGPRATAFLAAVIVLTATPTGLPFHAMNVEDISTTKMS